MSPNRGAQANSVSAPLPEIGQPFNPYKRFNGSFVPEQICRYRGLSPGAKLVYGRLCRYAGENGAVYPSIPTLADETGFSEAQVRAYIKQLERKQFIRVDRENRHYQADGSGGSNQYTFLVHEVFVEAGDPRKAPPPLRKTEGVPLQKTEGVPLRETAPLTPAENRTRRESVFSRESTQESQSNPDDRFARSENGDSRVPRTPRASDDAPNDRLATPESHAAGPRCYSDDERKWLSEAIGLYGQKRTMRDHMGREAPPVIVQKCLDAANGASVQEIVQVLRQRCLNGCEPGTSSGPHSWGWFPVVIADGTQSWRGQEAATQRHGPPHSETSGAQAATEKPDLRWARNHLISRAERLRRCDGYEDIASEIEKMAGDEEDHRDLGTIEDRLTMLEEKMISVAHSRQSEADRSQINREVKRQLDPYRGKMSQEQLSMLEHQYFTRYLLEHVGLPRLSLFYAGRDLECAA